MKKLATCFARNAITFFNKCMKTKCTTLYKNNSVLLLLTAFSEILDLQMCGSVSKNKKYTLCFITYHSLFADVSFDIICSLKLFHCLLAFHRSVIGNEILTFNPYSAARHYILCEGQVTVDS